MCVLQWGVQKIAGAGGGLLLCLFVCCSCLFPVFLFCLSPSPQPPPPWVKMFIAVVCGPTLYSCKAMMTYLSFCISEIDFMRPSKI